jgi:hypothetical protein
MREVSTISESTDATSTKVLADADQVARNADTLRAEVTEFLRDMASPDDEDRRRFERIPGRGTPAVLRVSGRAPLHVTIADISRGGVAMHCDWQAEAGTEVQIELPGTDQPVMARTVHCDGGVLGLVFHQDAAMLRHVDLALAEIGARPSAAAA